MDIVTQPIADYLLRVTPARDAVLEKMEALARREGFPIVGPLVGRLLYQLALLIGARRIFELGSGYGYSAVWFARAMGPEGRIICTEGAEENRRRAQRFFGEAGIGECVEFRVGDGLELIEEYPGPFDVIFCDVDKEQYPDAFEKAVPRLRKGGLFIVDNTLWMGEVLVDATDAATAGVKELTRLLYTTPDMFTTIIPLRDGVAVSIRR